jgi:hypothetical protein
MRDIRGRYTKTKELTEIIPTWAQGCDQCECGVLDAPPLTGLASLYMERLVQAIDHELTFCSCMAGTRYHAALLNRRRVLIEEAKKDKRLSEWSMRGTHPDIEATRRAMRRKREEQSTIPTIHFDEVTA